MNPSLIPTVARATVTDRQVQTGSTALMNLRSSRDFFMTHRMVTVSIASRAHRNKANRMNEASMDNLIIRILAN